MTIAALYVESNGTYFGDPEIDPWDIERDARAYAGPHVVIAHPPCARWCRLAGLVQARWGHRIGDDGGCFAQALACVRAFGGVLEHPAYSLAFAHYGITRPPTVGGWVPTACGGWACHVEQGHFGHKARKATWLYVKGNRNPLPPLLWGRSSAQAQCSNMYRLVNGERDPATTPEWLSKGEALQTPPLFKALLKSIARDCQP